MITVRQQQLLKEIVEKYVTEVEPVSSKLLTQRLTVSSATIRNEMNELEKQGLIFQPHTSAGRVPTVAGYKFYVENFVDKHSALSNQDKEKLLQLWQAKHQEIDIVFKNIAKLISDITRNAVLVGFTPHSFYYTGLANLFNQPEFTEVNLVRSIGYVVDHLDEVAQNIFNEIDDIEIKIGDENPFGRECSVLLTKFPYNQAEGLLGILGPARMDYQKSFSLLTYLNQLTAQAHE
jgi:heat-inducible transcriptional repressor